MTSDEMIIPTELLELIESGKWLGPKSDGMERSRAIVKQQASPLVSKEKVQRFAPDESFVALFPPPFTPLSIEKLAINHFLGTPDPAYPPGDLDFFKCLDIADFGLGSDSPIVLDYRFSLENPCVLRLRWNTDGVRFRNRWVTVAPTFREFAVLLGFLE
jgi:hypothetical protein